MTVSCYVVWLIWLFFGGLLAGKGLGSILTDYEHKLNFCWCLFKDFTHKSILRSAPWYLSMLLLITVVTISFVNTSYSVGEEDNSINLEVAVLDGSLESAVTVEFSTASVTANCEFYNYC